MNKVSRAISEFNQISQQAREHQKINRIHPLVKLAVTIFYIATVVSFSKYDFTGLVSMSIYLIAGFILEELSIRECFWRLRIILPLVCLIGIANPFLDTTPVSIGPIVIRAGVISMITLMMKGVFAVLASYLLIATTTIEQICYALRLLHVPQIMVTQILLIYRYFSLLLGEVQRITQAYSLRAPGEKGVRFRVWGSLTGQLLLRSIDRANDMYESMTLRGYHGEFAYVGTGERFRLQDALYFVFWIGLFLLFRNVQVIFVIGKLLGG